MSTKQDNPTLPPVEQVRLEVTIPSKLGELETHLVDIPEKYREQVNNKTKVTSSCSCTTPEVVDQGAKIRVGYKGGFGEGKNEVSSQSVYIFFNDGRPDLVPNGKGSNVYNYKKSYLALDIKFTQKPT